MLAVPGVPMPTVFGLALAAAIKSGIDWIGPFAFAATSSGAVLIMVIDSKSRSSSNGMSLKTAGLTANSPVCAVSNV